MKLINVRKKEINIKDPTKLLIEDEVAPELIRFVLTDVSDVVNISSLGFYLQYRNRLGELGVEALTKTYSDGVLTLDWYPSSSFTKESGRIEIQIIGYLAEVGSDPVTRWSSLKTVVTLPENITGTITLVDKRQRAQLASILG